MKIIQRAKEDLMGITIMVVVQLIITLCVNSLFSVHADWPWWKGILYFVIQFVILMLLLSGVVLLKHRSPNDNLN